MESPAIIETVFLAIPAWLRVLAMTGWLTLLVSFVVWPLPGQSRWSAFFYSIVYPVALGVAIYAAAVAILYALG